MAAIYNCLGLNMLFFERVPWDRMGVWKYENGLMEAVKKIRLLRGCGRNWGWWREGY